MDSPDRPNAMIVVLDDMRADMMEGMPLTRTILSEGAVLTNAHAPTPQCSPLRCALQTGRYAHNTGMHRNRTSAGRFRAAGLARASYPYLLKELGGYRTAHFGKYLNFFDAVAPWVPAGYDRFVATLLDRAPVMANAQGRVKRMKWPSSEATRAGEPVWRNAETEFLSHLCADWIGGQQEPWCATLSLSAPHDPYTPEPEDVGDYANVPMPKTDAFDNDDPGKPGYVRREPLTAAEKAEMETTWRGKMEELKGADRRLSALLSAVDFETTYVFLLSDGGYHLGENRLYKKQRPYTVSTNVPLLVRGPGVMDADSDLLVSALDVTATIAELAGIEEGWPEGSPLDGRSLSPILFSSPAEPAEASGWRSSLLIEQAREYGPEHGAWEAVRTPEALYVEHTETGESELYDLADDPDQVKSLQADPDRLVEADALAKVLSDLAGNAGEGLRSAEAV